MPVCELCFLFREHHMATILTCQQVCTFVCSFAKNQFNTNELLNLISVESAVSNSVFHAFQCVAMQTAF